MNTYRVTYVESILRETTVEAADPDQAIDTAHSELDGADHHHAVDVWQDDWQAESAKSPSAPNQRCFECGQRWE